MPQLRVPMPQLRSPPATTKTRCNQINKYLKKQKNEWGWWIGGHYNTHQYSYKPSVQLYVFTPSKKINSAWLFSSQLDHKLLKGRTTSSSYFMSPAAPCTQLALHIINWKKKTKIEIKVELRLNTVHSTDICVELSLLPFLFNFSICKYTKFNAFKEAPRPLPNTNSYSLRHVMTTKWNMSVALFKASKNNIFGDFPGGAVVKNPPANAGDTGSGPGPGRSHMPRSN